MPDDMLQRLQHVHGNIPLQNPIQPRRQSRNPPQHPPQLPHLSSPPPTNKIDPHAPDPHPMPHPQRLDPNPRPNNDNPPPPAPQPSQRPEKQRVIRAIHRRLHQHHHSRQPALKDVVFEDGVQARSVSCVGDDGPPVLDVAIKRASPRKPSVADGTPLPQCYAVHQADIQYRDTPSPEQKTRPNHQHLAEKDSRREKDQLNPLPHLKPARKRRNQHRHFPRLYPPPHRPQLTDLHRNPSKKKKKNIPWLRQKETPPPSPIGT
ncbi:hypothetical protein CDD80_1437 [Ophiocordyceps camponoti-rufipedis]|uniref:Uncharacterized protein n=1 Tax=Ophiocordyceps camponoti-rufipedis TaxID=2004952 RepID=A0A2C5Y399_9HYPO|nr:hypothetical protein CDD80_1437 [Ophiocordyceps camponoti-rufipedis]